MIIVKNRELLIPGPERYIGTTYDTESENRQFVLSRFAQNGVDLSALTFRLDLKYANDATDTVVLDKEVTDTNIILTWNIGSSVLQVPGTLFIQLRAVDDEVTVKWSSFHAALYVERHLNAPGTYSGSLTEIEQMEQDHQYMKGVVDELKSHIDYTHEAEAWAIGKKDGEDVPSTDETYHNNSKYYSDQASTKATQAANSATAAANSATQAAETVSDTNTRFNNAMAAVTSETEVIDARVGADGTQHTVLKDRLDAEHTQLKNAIAESLVPQDATWESGKIDTTNGENISGTGTRNPTYIDTASVDKFINSGAGGCSIIYYNLVNGSYVFQRYYWVAANTTHTIQTQYGYCRAYIALAFSNSPQKNLRYYKYTQLYDDVETLKSHEQGLYEADVSVESSAECSWKKNGNSVALYIAGNIYFTGYPSSDYIRKNDVLSAASAAGLTVSDGIISGNMYAIYYDINAGTVKVTTSPTFKPTSSEKILFRHYYGNWISGGLVWYAVRVGWMSLVDRVSALERTVDTETSLPDYWVTYLESKIADVQAKDMIVGNHGDSFVFVTDLHYVTNDGNSAGATKYVLDHSSVTKVIIGGDICNGDTTSKQGCIDQILACRNDFRAINPYYLRGNHDNNTEIASPTPEKALSDSELYGMILKPIENKIIGDRTFHYYFDNEVEKVRYICLDTGHPDTNVISDAQITWMQERITELSAGWTVIVLTHQYYSTVGTMDGNGQKILAGLNAIYDTASATIAGVICGHSHADYMETTTKGFPVICTTCDVRGGQSSAVPLTRTAGTYTEQAFDVFHIDTSARKICATRIGAGSDRETTY